MTTKKCICVWYDRYSDPDDNGWVVSRDEIDEQGRADTTHTESMHTDEASAVEAARKLGEKLGLPVYRNDEGRAPELLQAVGAE